MTHTISLGLAAFGLTLALARPALAQAEPPPPPDTEAEDTGPMKVLVFDLEAVDVDADKLKFFNGTIARAMSQSSSVELLTQQDMRRLLSAEAQAQAAGCNNEACLIEVAGALGARYLVFGQVGRLGDQYLAQINLLDSNSARAVAREEVRGESLSDLHDALEPAVARVAAALEPPGSNPKGDETRGAAPAGGSGGVFTSPLFLGGAGLAAVGVVVGVVGAVIAIGMDQTLADTDSTPAEKQQALSLGPIMIATTIAGGLTAVTGGALIGVAFILEE